ncbi:TPA: RNA polymerase sigma factor [Clostridioides difficile]|uniref:Sigma-70 family RNA polymerase sigma factor n=2 Tax=Clostridioides difficile TaxID=1496 RepID=A0AB74QJL1_CLODI|nr:RNA polymerase sigma factor [Clostridioides difficile]EIS9447441.1 RNA polymerase sigma factor [Clostridioides difficile]EIS9595068.1 RNA polymerase sigma factor [Clostridioides difficile]ELX4591883.1 RNA polymerase sigma factor [Clostridioides difficile]MBH6835580.1 RNA polymerase sigma factor [Clostridioides difficile]MBZ0834567.1 RNA polymerase sigma factor [Clostridioides difficile]
MILYLNLLESENDISKFELLYNTYKKTMFYIANEILKDECLAEDAVHESFLKIIKNLNKINDIKSYKTKAFVIIIVKNTSKDIYRKRKRENEKIKSLEKEFQSDKFHIDEYSIGYLEEAIMKLSEKHRDVLLLKLQHELNDKEISQILDIKPENVRKRLSRAREELKYIFIKDVGV